MFSQFITVILALASVQGFPLMVHKPRVQQYSLIEQLQYRVDHSDATNIVKSLHNHVLSFKSPPSGSLSFHLSELSLSIERNLVSAAIMNETCDLRTLNYFTRLRHAGEAIENSIQQLDRISPTYWALAVPFQFTLKSTLAYRRWQFQRSQYDALRSTNATRLLQETRRIVQDTCVLLEAAAYMLRQLQKLGLQKLHSLCQPVLSDALKPLLHQLPQESLHSLGSQLKSLIDEDPSRHRNAELALSSVLVLLLGTSSLLLLPLMCEDRSSLVMLARCFLYIAGITWFHMMVFFLYFCKLRRDFEI